MWSGAGRGSVMERGAEDVRCGNMLVMPKRGMVKV
jgi:hypothetical protein